MFELVKGVKIFSRLDSKEVFHQIRMMQSIVEKATLNAKNFLLEYSVIPKGVCNDQAAFNAWKFQLLMNEFLHDLLMISWV